MSKIVSAEALKRMLSTSHDESLESPIRSPSSRSPGGAMGARSRAQISPGAGGDGSRPIAKAVPKSPSATSKHSMASASQFKPVSSAVTARTEPKPVVTMAPSSGEIIIGQSKTFTSGAVFAQQSKPSTTSMFQASALPKYDTSGLNAAKDQQVCC